MEDFSNVQELIIVEIPGKDLIELLTGYIGKMARWENNNNAVGDLLVTMDCEDKKIIFSNKHEISNAYTEIEVDANFKLLEQINSREFFFFTKANYLDSEISGHSSEECILTFIKTSNDCLRIRNVRIRGQIQTSKSTDELFLFNLDGGHEFHQRKENGCKWKFHMSSKMQRLFKDEFELFSTKYSEGNIFFKLEKISDNKIILHFSTAKMEMESTMEIEITRDEGEFENCIGISYNVKSIAKFCRLFKNFEKEKFEFMLDSEHNLNITSVEDKVRVTGKFEGLVHNDENEYD
jgi:hypothetical protein